MKEVPLWEWPTTSAAEVMVPMGQPNAPILTLGYGLPSEEMDRDGVNQLPVTKDHQRHPGC